MVIVLYLLIILSSVAQSSAAKLFNRRSSSSVIFNTVKSYTALVLFALTAVSDSITSSPWCAASHRSCFSNSEVKYQKAGNV